jgi:hypothetical protein
MRDPAPYAIALWAITILFLLRVLGQLVVATARPRWLPRMEQWYSGLLAYRYLLPVQLLILGIMVAVACGFTAGHGVLVDPRRPVPGRWLVGYSYLYMTAMLVRYVVWMKRRPDQRWLGGTIPIVFHLVLALFLYVVGRYHAP